MKHLAIGFALIAAGLPATEAAAQGAEAQDAFVKIGLARIRLADEGKIYADGVLDPGADYVTPEKWVASIEAGYFLTDTIALQVAGTTPATTSNVPAGSLAGLPNLGNDTFSIFTATGTFHPFRDGPVSPYFGAGVAFQKTWSNEDVFAQNLDVHDAFGPVIQGGVDVRIADRFGVYLDAKKAFYKANASGDLGPTHIDAKAELDPLILQAGALIRF